MTSPGGSHASAVQRNQTWEMEGLGASLFNLLTVTITRNTLVAGYPRLVLSYVTKQTYQYMYIILMTYCFMYITLSTIHFLCFYMYRSSVKEWQVSWFVLGAITLNGTDIVFCKYCRTVRTKRLHISIKSFYCSVCAIQSYCPQNKPADLPLFYWRPVCTYIHTYII